MPKSGNSGVKIGVDEVNVPIYGCSIGREGIKVLAEGLSGGLQIDGGQPHDDFIHQWSVLDAVEGELSLVGLQTGQRGWGK